MPAFDIGLVVAFAIPLFFWLRGVWRRSVADSAVGGGMFAVAAGGYLYFFAYTNWVGLPWMALALCALASGAIIVLRGRGRGAAASWLFAAIPLCLAGAAFVGERQWIDSANSLLIIAPYRSGTAGTWVFDEPRLGLRAEPFINGIPELIDKLVAEAGIKNADRGFRLIFSAKPFPGCQEKVTWRRADQGGNWYYSEKYDMEGWLCPALFKYFKRAPREIYVRAEAK